MVAIKSKVTGNGKLVSVFLLGLICLGCVRPVTTPSYIEATPTATQTNTIEPTAESTFTLEAPTPKAPTPTPTITRRATGTSALIDLSPMSQPTFTPDPNLTPTIKPTNTLIPTPSPTPKFYREPVETGIGEIDLILQAVLSEDWVTIRNLLYFDLEGCTFELGMGGPPKCREGENEGDLVEVFSIAGPSEWLKLRPDEIGESFEITGVLGVYAVYYVSEPISPIDNIQIYLVGRYEDYVLSVEQGKIVLLDYVLFDTPEERLDKVAFEIILPPPTQSSPILMSPPTAEPFKSPAVASPTRRIAQIAPFHRPDVRTGIGSIDQIIEAVLQRDLAKQKELIAFTTVGCTQKDGLGGPPKCRDGEDEGTPLEVLPILGSEGHFRRKGEFDDWRGFDVSGLYAVYTVSDKSFSSDIYPAGEFGIMFVTDHPEVSVILHVTNGRIVRLDYELGRTPQQTLKREAGEFILRPPEE